MFGYLLPSIIIRQKWQNKMCQFPFSSRITTINNIPSNEPIGYLREGKLFQTSLIRLICLQSLLLYKILVILCRLPNVSCLLLYDVILLYYVDVRCYYWSLCRIILGFGILGGSEHHFVIRTMTDVGTKPLRQCYVSDPIG